MDVSQGTLLGGRVRYAQPVDGYRTGIEPVMLAAAVPARAGELVLEAGTGAGAGLLCLSWRVPGVVATGIELDPGMAALARENAAANGVAATVVAGDVARDLSGAPGLGPFDHVFANPPWHDPAGTAPVGARRVLAKQRGDGGLAAWIGPLAAATRGSVTLALPAVLAAEAMGLLAAAGLGRATVFPLWPRAGVAAKLVLVQGWHGADSRTTGAGLVLHGAAGGYTAAAEAVLRGGAALAV